MGVFGDLPGIPKWFLHSPFAFFVDGISAVALFFVLSSFVLTYKAFSSPQRYSLNDSLVGYLIHRVMRIVPPFIAWVVISALCQRYVMPHVSVVSGVSSWFHEIWAQPASLERIVRECFIFAPAAGGHLVTQDWSLTIEMNVSLFIPLYTVLALAGNFPFLFYLCLRMTTKIFLFPFFLGILLSKNVVKIQNIVRNLNPAYCFLLFITGLGLYSIRQTFGPAIADLFPLHFNDVITILNSSGSAVIIAVALGSIKFQKILEHRSLIWLGRVSYSLYLLHIAVLKCVSLPMIEFLDHHGVGRSDGLWICLFVSVSVALFLSEISFVLFEETAIRAGKILSHQVNLFSIRIFQ